MANVYGVNYQREWIAEPSLKAAKGTRNAPIKGQYEEFSGVASTDVLYICKVQTPAIFLGLEAVVGTLGAGAVQKIDASGVASALAKGDVVDNHIITVTADVSTTASLKVIAQFLMD